MTTQRGIFLRFFVHENRRHQGILLYEWLLEHAKELRIHGGSAFRAMAGYGRHGVMHEQHFFELAGDLPVRVDFIVTADDAKRLLAAIENENLSIFYSSIETEFGVTNSTRNDNDA